MKKDYIFNTIAGFVDASEAVIMLMLITRSAGLREAGYVSIGFAIGILLLTVGKYGVYSFQVTDHKGEYAFITYLESRIITVSLMLLCLCAYLIYGKFTLSYSHEKVLIIAFIGLIYAIEAFEDLIRAHCQFINKLYVGSLIFIIRWLTILVSFGITIYNTHNTSLSLAISLLLSIFAFIICCFIFNARSIFTIPKLKIDHSISYTVVNLLRTCFPLFLSSFLSFYIVNSPKYAIERYMAPEILACYGFVAMPVFVIGMLNGFIFMPQLTSLANDYSNNKFSSFKKRIYHQYLIIAILTSVCLIGAYFIGIPILSLIYHANLDNYHFELYILLLGGGLLALSGYQGTILTIMRKQTKLLYGYISVAILAFLFVGYTVKKHGTMGAAFSYLILILILCILYEVFIRKELSNAS